jgi:hypothetical protein
MNIEKRGEGDELQLLECLEHSFPFLVAAPERRVGDDVGGELLELVAQLDRHALLLLIRQLSLPAGHHRQGAIRHGRCHHLIWEGFIFSANSIALVMCLGTTMTSTWSQ